MIISATSVFWIVQRKSRESNLFICLVILEIGLKISYYFFIQLEKDEAERKLIIQQLNMNTIRNTQ